MPETPQQEVYRLQQEIARRLDRLNQILGNPPITDVVGTTSTRMRRYMNAVSDHQPARPEAEPYVHFPEPTRPRDPEPGED